MLFFVVKIIFVLLFVEIEILWILIVIFFLLRWIRGYFVRLICVDDILFRVI